MKSFVKVIALILVFVAAVGVLAACGDKPKPNKNTSSAIKIVEKPKAQDVIDKYNTDKKEVTTVPHTRYISNEIQLDEKAKVSVFENATSGDFNGVDFRIDDVKAENKDTKYAQFYAEMKKIILSIDAKITPARADELVKYLNQIQPKDISVSTTRNVEENGFTYSIFYTNEQLVFTVT
ncbi:MAG: hypothetical protein LBS74_01425 [Oscillospiraceae bacterium]|nr:hypothetical protein [Oscillospiraceae bacterium]